jgi:hypothetical protein
LSATAESDNGALCHYLDASALVKLVLDEPESRGLKRFLGRGAWIASSELVLVEVPRAVRRGCAGRAGRLDRRRMRITGEILEGVDLVEVDTALLVEAGALPGDALGSLDAIHVATALSLAGALESFVSYDRRQVEVALELGLPAVSPSSGTT